MATIITTASGTTSNSYITTAEATTYFLKNPLFYSAWDVISDKDTWVLYAAQAIDRLGFTGARYDEDQSMEFPRDITDEYTDDGVIPQAVKDAQCEMIIYLHMHVDNITMKPHQKIYSSDIDSGAIKTSYEKKDDTIERIAVGGSIETINSLLRIWMGSRYSAHLRRK